MSAISAYFQGPGDVATVNIVENSAHGRDRTTTLREVALCSIFILLSLLMPRPSAAFPLSGDQTVLPPGTELAEETLQRPRELLHSEAVGGHRSYLVNLGDLAFNAPAVLGGTARRAEMSCGTCHVNGASNPKFFIPGLSTRAGNFDTSNLLFNPKAFNSLLDPVRIPSLRGARFLAPYGHDGRSFSLRDFVHNVIVNEFAGPEPSPEILDALVAYITDIDFLPNPRIGPGGSLVAPGNAERRGETLFFKPFPHQPSLSCARCHVPSAAFADQQRHNVGSGGLMKTPPLLNANFNAPYFHDGRYDSYEQVVSHFNRVFDLHLSTDEIQDLVAYLNAVGDGERPLERDGVAIRMKEVRELASVLELSIPAGDKTIVSLAVAGVGADLRELAERIPDVRDTAVNGGEQERLSARAAVKELVLHLRRIEMEVADGHLDEAATDYLTFTQLTTFDVPVILKKAEPWSLFNADVQGAHYSALGHILQSAGRQTQ
jgi:cytochrome c peroxidase